MPDWDKGICACSIKCRECTDNNVPNDIQINCRGECCHFVFLAKVSGRNRKFEESFICAQDKLVAPQFYNHELVPQFYNLSSVPNYLHSIEHEVTHHTPLFSSVISTSWYNSSRHISFLSSVVLQYHATRTS